MGKPLKCMLCMVQCHHLDAVLEWEKELGNDAIPDSLDDTEYDTKYQDWKTLSTQKIQYPPSSEQGRRHLELIDGGYKAMTDLYPKYRKDDRCPHNFPYEEGNPIANEWMNSTKQKAVLHYSNIGVSYPTTYYRPSKCGHPKCQQEYDGLKDNILHVSHSYLISHYLILTFISPMQSQKTKLTSFRKNIEDDRDDVGLHAPFHYASFQKAYWGFLKLIEIRNETRVFTCSQSEKLPRTTITCDGLQMGSLT